MNTHGVERQRGQLAVPVGQRQALGSQIAVPEQGNCGVEMPFSQSSPASMRKLPQVALCVGT